VVQAVVAEPPGREPPKTAPPDRGPAVLGKSRVTAITTTQRHGALVETLTELEPGVELVVVGKGGEHAGLGEGQLGAHLENLIRISVRPVLVANHACRPIERFLIAFDNSQSARKAAVTLHLRPRYCEGLNVIWSWLVALTPHTKAR
jgi:hypothetical protein